MTYNYEWKQHQEGLQKALMEQRKSSPHLCDMTLVSKDDHGVETSISAHKCILSISSGYLENVINLPDNHNHNLQLDISCMADPTSISQLVDFAYTGKISFTATDFDRLATAIDKLQIRNIDEVSINKIREDINLTNSKKTLPTSEVEPTCPATPPQATLPRVQQIMLSPSHISSQPKVIPFGVVPVESAASGPAKKGRPLVPKIEGIPHHLIGNNIQVLIQDPIMSIPKIDYRGDDRGDPVLEETDNLLSLLKMNYDEVANCARSHLENLIERLKLTNSQRAAIWEVRRKSKNRIAAARCRKRKIEDMKENDETIEQLRTIFETKQNQNWELRAALEQGLLGGSLAYSSCEDKYCGENAVCREDRSRDWFFMSEATCQCMEGYMSIETLPTGALTCVDINECDLNMCHSTQDCVNTEGGYQCTCKEGFVENRNLLTFEYAPCKSLQPHSGIEIRRRRQTDGGSGDGPEVVEVVEVVVTATLGTDVEWSEELNDKESDEFKDAAADVEANLAAILNDEGTTVECTGFQQSSSRRKRRAAGDTEAIVDITVQQEQEDTGDGAPAPDLAAIEEQVKDSVVASIQESDSFTVDESSITTTSKETTVTVYDGECSKIFEENPEVFDGPGTFKRKGPNWDNYFSFNKNSDSVGWAIPEDTKFQYNCKPKKWNPSQDIAFMCNSEDKIVLCDDEDCENPTDEELDIENAMWNCGEEDDETEGTCKNIFDSFDNVFEESNHWKWYMDGWNKWWKVELEDLQQSSGFKVGTYFSHRCNNDPNLKWRKKDISFKCTRFGDKVGFYQCEDRKCDEVLNRRIKPKAMSWRFTCED